MSEKKKTTNENTMIQFLKSTVMAVVVTALESFSLNPLYRGFSFIANEELRLLVANSISIVIFLLVRFFVNYFWVFHSKRKIAKILLPFAIQIVLVSIVSTAMIDGMMWLLSLSDGIVSGIGEDGIRLISKVVVTIVTGIASFAFSKRFIFDEKKPETAE